MSEKPADAIEVTLFRQILLVPFAIEATDARDTRLLRGRDRVARLAELLRAPWEEITERRWRHLPTDDLATGDDLAAAYAEFVYFEPYAQRFLYGAAGDNATDSPIRLWRRRDITALDLAVQLGAEHPLERYRLRVDRLSFYAFDTGNAFLVVEVAFDPGLAAKLPDADRGLPKLAQVQTVVERLRRVFPPYFAPFDTAGKSLDRLAAPLFPVSLRWVTGDPEQAPPDFTPDELMLAEHFTGFVEEHRVPPMHARWRELIADLPLEGFPESCKDCSVRLSQLGDDRAFSMTILGVDDPSRIAEADWVRLAMCDEPGEKWPYSPTFLEGWERKHGYDRHFDKDSGHNTRFLMSAYSFAMVGKALRPDDKAFCPYRDIFAGHGRRHYFQLCLIAYFQKAALLTLSERLADAMRLEGSSGGKSAHAIEADILQFTHRYWFESLSAQIQAQEIFDRLRDNLRLRQLYEQVRREVREADAFATSAEQQRIARNQNRLNVIAGVGLTLAVVVGVFGMNVFDDKRHPGWPIDVFTLTAVGGFLLAGFAALYIWADELEDLFRARRRWRWAMVGVPVVLCGAGILGMLFR